MLTLTRREKEYIVIGKNPQVRVHVTKIDGGKVRLSVDADPSVPIDRGEVADRKAKAA